MELKDAIELVKGMINPTTYPKHQEALRTVIEAAEELIEIKKMMQDEFNKVREGGE